MSGFNHPAFFAELRLRQGPLSQDKVDDLNAAIEVGLGMKAKSSASAPPDPPWLALARRHMGEKEIPGPRHSAFVTGLWKLLGQPIADDETPWCGGFVGFVIKMAGLQPVAKPAWARNWANWGKACDPALGAVAVFGRAGGGGHVGFLVGVSADGSLLYVLGGNQSNAVNIMPIARSRLLNLRWPSHLPVGGRAPIMSGGVVSRNEA